MKQKIVQKIECERAIKKVPLKWKRVESRKQRSWVKIGRVKKRGKWGIPKP